METDNNIKKEKHPISNKIYALLLVLSTCFMCVGYAVVNSVTLNISGSASTELQDGVFITNVEINNNVNAQLENTDINSAFQTVLNSSIALSTTDPSSSITYDITVYNSSSDIYAFTGAIHNNDFYSNANIAYEIIGLAVGDTMEPQSYLTFKVKFYYLDKNDITNNTLDSIINFKFETNTWQAISVYGMSSYKVISSKENSSVSINYTSVGNQYEKVNLPLQNLEVGSFYQLTFTVWNDSGVITSGKPETLMYGCTVMPNPATDYLKPWNLIAYDGFNSGYLWKSISTDEQTATLTFKATATTMYWVWDLSLLLDEEGNLYINDIDIKKSITPTGAYIDVPNTTIYQKEYLNPGTAETLTIQKGTYVTKADYDELIVKVQTAGGFEFINIPIKNLNVGQTYTISFSNSTTDAAKVNLLYGAKVQSNKQEGGNQLITTSDYNINDISIVNTGTIRFTATSSTMYWVWDLGGLDDYRWSNINIYDITLN